MKRMKSSVSFARGAPAVLLLSIVAALATGMIVRAAAGTEIDMTVAENSVTYNDAVFTQGPLDVNSAGTGVIDPFLTVGGGGNQAITRGYNTVDGSAEFDTVTGGERTRPLLLSGVPEVDIGGASYREFKLDINKAPGGSPYLALNELKLFLTSDPAVTGYDYTGGTEFGSNATKVWDLGDAVVLMDYSLESGSGASDVSFFVRSNVFTTTEDCSYGSPDCQTYVVMWNEYGNYTDSALYPNRTWGDNDGFEEWGIVLRPVVDADKSATGSYDERHEWEVEKTVDPASQSAFAGETVDFDWTITVTETVFEENLAASGTITIHNPTGCDGEPFCPVLEPVPADILSVDDVIDQAGLETTATVDCGVAFPYTLDGGETLTCSYSATTPNADDGLNTATVTVDVPEDIGGGTDTYQATADLTFTANLIRGSATLDDDQFPYTDEPVNDGWTNTYSDSYTCSSTASDYTDGADLDNAVSNTAEVYSSGTLQDSSTATTEIDCYIPSIEKTAAGTYDERHEWEVEKTVDPSSQSAFVGDTVEFDWTITVTETVFEENFDVAGTITVDNPNPDDVLVVSLVDSVNGNAVTIDQSSCSFDGTDLTVAAGGSETCNYTADNLPYSELAQAPDTNTATITLNGIDFDASDPIEWTANVIRGSATLDDDQFPYVDEAVSGGWTSTYSDTYTCSTLLSDYTNGEDLDNQVSNTAEVYSSGALQDSSTAISEIDCYAPTVEKDATAEWNEEYDWSITKTVDPEIHSGSPGDQFTSVYTVTVDRTFTETFQATGTISVTNPAGAPDAITVDVADAVGPYAGTVDCDGAGGTSLTVAAGDTGTCSYTVGLPDAETRTNTATATFNGIDFTATADVVFGEPIVDGYPTINVTDYFDGDRVGDPLGSASDDFIFEYSRDFECPTDEDLYTEGMYTDAFPNFAEIDETGQQDDANVDITCTADPVGRIIVDKVTDPSGAEQLFTFNPSWGPSFQLADQDTPHDSGPLSPGTYSVSETVPAGWELDSAVCVSSNPEDQEAPGSISLQAGETVRCTFTNIQQGHIIVDKVTNPSGAEQLFTFSPSWGPSFELADQDPPHDSGPLSPGTYSVTETVPAGWELVDAFCSDESDPANINLGAGETVTCTFTNMGEPAYVFQKFVNGEDADTLEEAVSVEAGDTLTFTYMLTNTGNITVTWTTLTDDVFGDLTEECELPIAVSVGETATCDILRPAQDREQGQQNVGTASVEGLEDQTDPAWYRTSTPTPVELLYFRAQGTGSAIRLEWGVAAEIDMSGYYLYRAESSRFSLAERLAFRVAQGSYSTYEYLDKNIEPGKTYWYWLVSIETNGTEEREGPVQASMVASAPSGGFRVFLPFLVRGH